MGQFACDVSFQCPWIPELPISMADGVKDPLSMSLDDIIAKSSKRTDSTRGRSGRGGRGGPRGGGSRGRDRRSGETVKVVVRNEGRIQKQVGTRRPLGRVRCIVWVALRPSASGQAFTSCCTLLQGRQGLTEADEPGHIKSAKLDGDMRWGHDKAPRDAAPLRRPVAPLSQLAPAATSRPVGSSKL